MEMDLADSRHDGKARPATEEDLEEGVEPDEVSLEDTVEEEAEEEKSRSASARPMILFAST